MITIELYQDTVCPWCRIGKRNLELALEQWQGETVAVIHKPFFLNNQIPEGGFDFRPYMQAKAGNRFPVEQFFTAPAQMGEAVGLTFSFEKITRAPNSTRSHMLIALTPPENQESMIDALYTAYFELGEDIGDTEVLVKIAAGQGLDAAQARASLEDPALRAKVLAEADEAHALGISGVPFFIINRQFAFSGAQPAEVILKVLAQVPL